jgi:hypothetical protein
MVLADELVSTFGGYVVRNKYLNREELQQLFGV